MSVIARRTQEVLAVALGPHLKAEGFKKNGSTWRRVLPDAVQLVNIQISKERAADLGQFTLNLALAPLDAEGRLADPFSSPCEALKVLEPMCRLRVRLPHLAPMDDQWWPVGPAIDPAATGRTVFALFRLFGEPWFALETLRMQQPPGPVARGERAEVDPQPLAAWAAALRGLPADSAWPVYGAEEVAAPVTAHVDAEPAALPAATAGAEGATSVPLAWPLRTPAPTGPAYGDGTPYGPTRASSCWRPFQYEGASVADMKVLWIYARGIWRCGDLAETADALGVACKLRRPLLAAGEADWMRARAPTLAEIAAAIRRDLARLYGLPNLVRNRSLGNPSPRFGAAELAAEQAELLPYLQGLGETWDELLAVISALEPLAAGAANPETGVNLPVGARARLWARNTRRDLMRALGFQKALNTLSPT